MRNMKKINFALALTTLLNSLITRADFTVGGQASRSPGSYSGTTILAAVIIIVIILILLYLKFAKKNKKIKK